MVRLVCSVSAAALAVTAANTRLNAQSVCSENVSHPNVVTPLRDKSAAPLTGCADAKLAGDGNPIDQVLYTVAPVGIAPKCDGSPEKSAIESDVVAVDGNQQFTVNLRTRLVSGEHLCFAQSAKPIDTTAKRSWSKATLIDVPKQFNEHAPLGAIIAGVDVAAASATDPEAVLLALGVFDLPLSNTIDSFPDQHTFWASGQLGLKGMAQPTSLSSVASASFYTSALGAPPDHIVQSMDAGGHLGFQLKRFNIGSNSLDSGTPTDSSAPPRTIATISLIAGGGAITPLSAGQSEAQIYQATSQIMTSTAFAQPTYAPSCAVAAGGKPSCFVAFVPADRTHFYRYWDAGFRLKLYGRDNADNQLRFPMMVDFTVGQNSYVTGGRLGRGVLHLSGSAPLPLLDGFYVFGSLDMAIPESDSGVAQLILLPDTSSTKKTLADPSVYAITVRSPERDRYQFGIAIDLTHLLVKLKAASQPAPAAK